MDPEVLRFGEVLGTSLGIGLLIGLDRERKHDSRGLRTFALISLFGALTAVAAQRLELPILPAIGLAAVTLLAISAYRGEDSRDAEGRAEAPTTSVVAMVVTWFLGLLCGIGDFGHAVAIGIVVVSLLHFKGALSGFAGRITPDDFTSILQFGALSVLVLPLLPDVAYGPDGSLNPREIWLMVVLVAGVGLAGYLALRLAGQRYGAPLAAIAGGLVSSTATTLVMARHARAGGSAPAAATLILIANLTMLARLVLMTAIVAPALLSGIALVMGAAGVAGGGAALRLWRESRTDDAAPLPQVGNPTDLRVAVGFGLAYGLVSFLAAWLAARLGDAALLALAFASGLTDVDAISLSTLRRFQGGWIDAATVTDVIAIAVVANLLVKSVIAFSAGGREVGRRCAIGMALIALAIGSALLALRLT